MEGKIPCCGSVRQNVWTARSCDCPAEEEEEGGKGDVRRRGGVNLTLIVGNVEMKEVLESPSRVELIFFPSSFFHEYQIETWGWQDGFKVVNFKIKKQGEEGGGTSVLLQQAHSLSLWNSLQILWGIICWDQRVDTSRRDGGGCAHLSWNLPSYADQMELVWMQTRLDFV